MNNERSTDEIIARLAEIYGADGMGGLWPTVEQWRYYLTCGYEGSIVTIGFYKIREIAAYEDKSIRKSGREALEKYAQLTTFFDHGGVPIYSGPYSGEIIGSDNIKWDFVVVSKYPSIMTLVQILIDEKYFDAIPHRVAAQDNHRLVISFIDA